MAETDRRVVLRAHGAAPFRVVLVHGGPGAPGELGPVARRLAAARGVLEPMQTATTLDGQVQELRAALVSRADPPVVLMGHSWGAWLSCLVAASSPCLVRKLILIGNGPFEEQYVPLLADNRLRRLSPEERDEFRALVRLLGQPRIDVPEGALERLGQLGTKTDTYDPIELDEPAFDTGVPNAAIYAGVWPEAARLRQTGELLRRVRRITCPVVAIHGAEDPHPADGVREPLTRVLPDFRMVVLDHCGHAPWRERQAADAFSALLEGELDR